MCATPRHLSGDRDRRAGSGSRGPSGLAVDSSGDAYISNDSSGAHAGEIIKVAGLS